MIPAITQKLSVALAPGLAPAIADYPPGSTFGPRTARYLQFIWLLQGRALWSCGSTRLALEPGRLLLVQPGMRDHIEWDAHRPSRHAYVHFTVASPPPRVAMENWPVTRPLDHDHGPTVALCRHVLRLSAARPPSWRQRSAAAVHALLTEFVAGAPTDDGDARVPPQIENMAAFVAAQWAGGVATPVNVTRLAAAAGTSPSTLGRLFRTRFGIGPVRALELVRLARAEPLLTMSNHTVGAIAAYCGFADAYHFSRRFRATYGVPPSHFRESGHGVGISPAAAHGLGPLIRLLQQSAQPAAAVASSRSSVTAAAASSAL